MAEELFILETEVEPVPFLMVDVSNPFNLSPRKFRQNFRLSKEAAWDLAQELKPFISRRNQGYSVEIQVLSVLHIMATGSFQHVIAGTRTAAASQPTLSRNMVRVLKGLLAISRRYISFPTSDMDKIVTSADFYEIAGFPNVLGAIDCTHIVVNRPKTNDWFVYLNRKGKFSINVQMVCDAKLRITNVVARWPGSSHDSFIWRLSNLRESLLESTRRGQPFLLGDSGYPLEPWLLTPFQDPTCPREELFNEKHAGTRNPIERLFGVVKSKFRMLHETGGTILYSPQKVCDIVVGAAVLHNICIQYRVPDYLSLDPEPEVYPEEAAETSDLNLYMQASELRNDLASQFQRDR